MMYLILCAASAMLFVIFAITALAVKKGKRIVFAVFAVIFAVSSFFCGMSYYNGGNSRKLLREISEYCNGDLKELINATKLEFENVSKNIYETDGLSVCVSDGKIVYVDLTTKNYTVNGFSGEFSRANTVYKGEEMSKSLDEVLNLYGFMQFSGEYIETEFADYNKTDIFAYDSKGRTMIFLFDENDNGKCIRYFPNPIFTENIICSAEILSENVFDFLTETEKLNLMEKEDAFKEECGKRVVWQLKTVDVFEDFILAERNGTEFKIYPLPQYMTKTALPKKDEYVEITGLFGGYEDTWVVKCALTDLNVSVSGTDEDIIGTFKNKSGELTIEENNGKLHLSGFSNYGAYTVDGNVTKINDKTYFYEGNEGDFYITIADGTIEVTTDTLKSFEGLYIAE